MTITVSTKKLSTKAAEKMLASGGVATAAVAYHGSTESYHITTKDGVRHPVTFNGFVAATKQLRNVTEHAHGKSYSA